MGKTLDYIKLAIEKGYKALENGEITSRRGDKLQIKLFGKQRYPTFSLNYGDGIFGIPIHQFNAYYFYGEKPPGMVVRHLDDNTLNNSKSNLVYGTHSENNLDKPQTVRINCAKKARASRNEEDFYKLNKDQREYIGLLYNACGNKSPNGFSSWLANMFEVNRNTITVTGRKYRQLLQSN